MVRILQGAAKFASVRDCLPRRGAVGCSGLGTLSCRVLGWPCAVGMAADPHASGVFSRVPGGVPRGRPGVCELRGHVHATLEEGRHRALPVQRLRALPQNEWHQPAAQATEKAGKMGETPQKAPAPSRGWLVGRRWGDVTMFPASGVSILGIRA